MSDQPPIHRLDRRDGPLVATAIHDGHALRPDLEPFVTLTDAERLREEDPYTGLWTAVAPNRVVVTRSRFALDLNRPRETAIYRQPADCWGLNVYGGGLPPEAAFARSMAEYDAFYADMRALLEDLVARHGRFVVYDLHSYNHRREGADGPEADPVTNPQVNVGTGTLNRARWGGVAEAFVGALSGYDFPGGRLDVRENVKFQGGNWPRWVNQNFPETGVAVAIEFKKFFMDEWSGLPDHHLIGSITAALESTVEPVLTALGRV